MLSVIRDVTVEPSQRLRLVFSDGVEGIIDLSEPIRAGGVFSPLADPEFFKLVRIGECGRFLEWPAEVDLCADALYREIQELVGEQMEVAITRNPK